MHADRKEDRLEAERRDKRAGILANRGARFNEFVHFICTRSNCEM